jgi:hypothetical protein
MDEFKAHFEVVKAVVHVEAVAEATKVHEAFEVEAIGEGNDDGLRIGSVDNFTRSRRATAGL